MYQIFPSGARKMETIQKFLPIHINKYTLTLTCPLNFKSHPAKSLITNIENISGKITENRTDSRKPILKRRRGKKKYHMQSSLSLSQSRFKCHNM